MDSNIVEEIILFMKVCVCPKCDNYLYCSYNFEDCDTHKALNELISQADKAKEKEVIRCIEAEKQFILEENDSTAFTRGQISGLNIAIQAIKKEILQHEKK